MKKTALYTFALFSFQLTAMEPSSIDNIIFDESAPFEQRADSLDRRLTKIPSNDQRINFLESLRSSNREFLDYAAHILICLNKQSSSFEICKAQKALRTVHRKYKLFLYVLPEVVYESVGTLPNYTSYYSSPKPTNYIPLRCRSLRHIEPDDKGLLFAFDTEYSPENPPLVAIDGSSLDLAWKVPTKTERPLFTRTDNTIYLADGSEIKALDKQTGQLQQTHQFNNQFPMLFLGVNPSGIMYVVEGEKEGTHTIQAYDTLDEYNKVFETTSVGGEEYFLHNNLFGYLQRRRITPDKKSELTPNLLILFPKNGPQRSIQLCLGWESLIYSPEITTHNNQLFFQNYDEKQNIYELQCLNCDDLSQKWSHNLGYGLRTNPSISPDGNCIFIIGRHCIKALKYNGETIHELWKTTIEPDDGLYQLACAPDGKTLCAIANWVTHELYTIDADTGIFSKTEISDNKLCGFTQNNLPYIGHQY